MKIDGRLARNIDFDVANFALHEKTRRKTSVFQVQSVKNGGGLVRNARFEASTCLVLTLWFCGGVPPCQYGKLQNLSFVSVSKDVEMAFCVAGVGLRDIVLCLQNVSNVILSDRRNTFERFAEDELQTFVAGAALWRLPSSFCVAGAAL